MKSFVALGSNLGDRRANLEKAAQAVSRLPAAKLLRASPIVETPALVPPGASEIWRKAFLNAVVEIEWQEKPRDLLKCLKLIEVELGRQPAPRWAPRLIDLDVLSCGDEIINAEDFQLPHSEMWNRQFVLTPLKHLAPAFRISGQEQTVLERSRALPSPIPLWMAVLNLTPDSFSDGNSLRNAEELEKRVKALDLENVPILDLGAESTRPGATPLAAPEEWKRLAPALEFVVTKFKSQIFCPAISVDTYHAETARKALAMGATILNDVSGLLSPAMIELLQQSTCQYVLMHSLTVPADPKVKLLGENPVTEIKEWLHQKLELLDTAGIQLDRVIFDPGIGFGKSPEQSLVLLQQIQSFSDIPVRLMVGHSRKSFLNQWGNHPTSDRDWETVGVSLALADKGVDILRVHTPDLHQRAFRAFRETQ